MLHAFDLKIIDASNEMIWNASVLNLDAWSYTIYCTRVISKVIRSVSEGGNAHPRSRFGLIDCDRKHLI
jgi:hypothetical protein